MKDFLAKTELLFGDLVLSDTYRNSSSADLEGHRICPLDMALEWPDLPISPSSTT